MGTIIACGISLNAVGLVILNFISADWILYVSMIILSFSEILAMPFMMTVAVKRSSEHNRGSYIGLYTTAWSAAFILSPLLGTWIISHYSFTVLWWIMSALICITAAGMLMIIPKLLPAKEVIITEEEKMEAVAAELLIDKVE